MGTALLFEAYPHVYGGAQQVTRALARHLPRAGWEPVVVMTGDGPVADLLRADGVRVQVVAAPPALDVYGEGLRSRRAAPAALALPRYWSRLRRALAGAAVAYTATLRGTILAGPAARLARVPLVWHAQGFEAGGVATVTAGLLARRVLAASDAVAATVRGRRRVEVVPPPWDPPGAPTLPRPPAEGGMGRAGPVIVTVGRLHPDKGIDVLVDAVARLRATWPDVTVRVLGGAQAGHDRYAERVRQKVVDLGLEGVVELCGFDAVPAVAVAAADVYVQPSRRESVGMATMEAMAIGRPVIASRVDGLAQLVDDGRTGLLVPPDDPEALATALDRVLADPALATSLGAAAAGAERRGPDVVVDRLAHVFAELARPGSDR